MEAKLIDAQPKADLVLFKDRSLSDGEALAQVFNSAVIQRHNYAMEIMELQNEQIRLLKTHGESAVLRPSYQVYAERIEQLQKELFNLHVNFLHVEATHAREFELRQGTYAVPSPEALTKLDEYKPHLCYVDMTTWHFWDYNPQAHAWVKGAQWYRPIPELNA